MGETEELISKYMEVMQEESPDIVANPTWNNDGSVSTDYFDPQSIYITDENGVKIKDTLKNNRDHFFCVEGNVKKLSDVLNIGYVVRNPDTKTILYTSLSTDGPKESWPKIQQGPMTFRARLPKHYLNAGSYKLTLVASLHNKVWLLDPTDSKAAVEINISGGISDSPFWKNPRDGLLAPVIEWSADQG